MFADEIPEAIQWHEGMLLAPQHFQESAMRSEMLLQYTALLLAPYCWGVRRLSLDTKLLPAGQFRVLELEAVLPDGSVATHIARDGEELGLDITAHADEMRQAPVTIHLTVPARSSATRGSFSRYVSFEGQPVTDQNTGEGEVRVPRLKPRLSLMAGETPPPKFVSIPLARIVFLDEAFTQAYYIPPAITVPPRSPLGELCGRVVTRLRQKAQYLSEIVRAPSVVLDRPMITEHRERIHVLVAQLPVFEALLASGVAHPISLFLSLCAIAGQTAALGDNLMPPVFAPYNHGNPLASFEEVITFIARMLDQGIPETYQAHPFLYKDGAYVQMFRTEWSGKRLVIGMRAGVAVSEKDMRVWGEECLIASASFIPSLRDKRILGATREFIDSDAELVAVRGVVLFKLENTHEFIRPGEPLHVLNFGERGVSHRPQEMVLYVKGG